MADRVLVAISKYYKHISDELEAGALEALEAAGATVTVMEVPGAFELPGLIAMAADSGRFDGAVALGCVIRG
ncbi:6,7-dimethyl-8-ribityllumazine synthase, partial [Hyphomonas sp. UBA3601]